MCLLLFTGCFGPGEDEGGDTAVRDLLVAGMQVEAVDGEGLEVMDLSTPPLYLPLLEEVFVSRPLRVGGVEFCQAAVAPQQGVNECGISYTEQISPPPVLGSDGKK